MPRLWAVLWLILWSSESSLGSLHTVGAIENDCPSDTPSCDETTIEDCDWNSLPEEYRKKMRRLGLTELMWDRSNEDDDEDSQIPYVEIGAWEHLPERYRTALETLGWDATSYDYNIRPPMSKYLWSKLTAEQQHAAGVLGYQKDDWYLMGRDISKSDFDPVRLDLEIPELKPFGFDYFLAMGDVEVELQDGTTTGSDMGGFEIEGYNMAMYTKDSLNGSTMYLKYEEFDDFKKKLPHELGMSVIKYLGGALKGSAELREKGHWKEEFDDREFSEYNWFVMVGGFNTTTAVHYDLDHINFLYVLEGRKRVILIPNDERTIDTFECMPEAEGNNCWPGVDILHTETLPSEYAVEIILKWWELSSREKKQVKEKGYTKHTWSKELYVGRGFPGVEPDEDDKEEYDKEMDAQAMEEEDWDDLPESYRTDLQLVGYTKTLWESDEDSYLDIARSELPTDVSAALKALKCDRGVGNAACFRKNWSSLSEVERNAGLLLGYHEEEWNGIFELAETTVRKSR